MSAEITLTTVPYVMNVRQGHRLLFSEDTAKRAAGLWRGLTHPH